MRMAAVSKSKRDFCVQSIVSNSPHIRSAVRAVIAGEQLEIARRFRPQQQLYLFEGLTVLNALLPGVGTEACRFGHDHQASGGICS